MQLIKHKTHIDFIGKWRGALFLSSLLNIAIIASGAIFGFNLGVDFAGGTVVEVRFTDAVTPEEVREGVVKGGLHEPTVQRIGDADQHSYLLRMGGTTQLTAAAAKAAEEAIRALGPMKFVQKPDIDNGVINFRSEQLLDEAVVKAAVEKASGTGVNEVKSLGAAQTGGFDYTLKSAGMAQKVEQALHDGVPGKKFEVRRVDYVGPQIGKQLRNKGIQALLFASLAILVYVAFRFDFKFAPGVLVGMVHDVVMVAGYFIVTRREFNLTSIAVLLTALGYSINDRIVVYDRIREEMVRYKGKPLAEIINIAVNMTLSRTILTSGVTSLSLIGLLIFGQGEIFDFAAAMLVGIVVGTYSSVYIASPLTIWLDNREARKGAGNLKAKTA